MDKTGNGDGTKPPRTKPRLVRSKRDYKPAQRSTRRAVADGIRLVVDNEEQAKRDAKQPLANGQGRNKHGLTSKQEAYAQNVSNMKTLAQSYREAYNAEGMSSNAVTTEASLLMDNPNVAKRVDELMKAKEDKGLHDSAKVRRLVLEGLHREATDTANPAAVRVRAMELLGKTASLFTDRVESVEVSADASPDSIEAAIAERLQRLAAGS